MVRLWNFAIVVPLAFGRLHRVELHVHLDGSLGIDTLYEICRERGIRFGDVQPQSPEDVKQFIESHPSWHRFDAVNDIIGGNASVIRQAAYAFVAFQARWGVDYTEVRYDPVRLARSNLLNVSISEEETVRAVQDGLASGSRHFRVAVHQIICAMRGQSEASCRKAAELAAKMRNRQMGGVVGLDLAGDESSYRNGPYVECFRYAKHVLGLNTTVHAGEFSDTGADEVRTAVLQMDVDRVGHGYAAAKDLETLKLLRERSIHLEACPKSASLHGLPMLQSLSVFKSHNLSFGLNTDDPSEIINNCTVADDERLVEESLGFSLEDIQRRYEDAFNARFGSSITQELAVVV